jgi:hypothetical protein
MDIVKAIVILGLAQGVCSWVYLYALPDNFFFTVLFCHKNAGLVLAFLISKLLHIKNKYIEEILYPLVPSVVGYQLIRLESYTRENHLLPNIVNLSGLETLVVYVVPFYVFWITTNLIKKKCFVLPTKN